MSFPNDRKRVTGPKLQRRQAAAVCQVPFPNTFTLPVHLEPETHASRISETLGFCLALLWRVLDPCKAEIPLLVERWRLRMVPEGVHRCANKNLDVDAQRRT